LSSLPFDDVDCAGDASPLQPALALNINGPDGRAEEELFVQQGAKLIPRDALRVEGGAKFSRKEIDELKQADKC